MTAYGLLAITEDYERIAEGIPIMKWLLGEQNDLGGFQSTQDTVVALQALARYAELMRIKEEVTLVLSVDGDRPECTFSITGNNSVVLQQYQVTTHYH